MAVAWLLGKLREEVNPLILVDNVTGDGDWGGQNCRS